MELEIINAIWIGRKMGAVHAACLASFLRHGHQVNLFVYEKPEDAPEGVIFKDANTLIPESEKICYKNGSPAIFANLLRYEILSQGLGMYVDCDVYCIKPVEKADYIFAYENAEYINNAILKLPQNSKTLANLLSIRKQKAFIPPFAKKSRRLRYRIRAALGFPVKIENMVWGTTGPRALTWYLKETGEDKYSSAIDRFYPIAGCQTDLLFDPELKLSDLITPRTQLIHLYNENLKHKNLADIPTGAPLNHMIRGEIN